MPSKGQRLEALQVLRAIAAGMVVYVHALATYKTKVDVFDAVLVNYGFGELGVKLFFCISGFIIFLSSQSLIQGPTSVWYFLRRRLIRIAPMYWCATLVYAVKLAVQGAAPGVDAMLYSVLFIPFVDSEGLMRPVLGAGWTLNYEMFFYIILGAALFLSNFWRLIFVSLVMLVLTGARHAGVISESSDLVKNALFLMSDTYLLFFVIGAWVGPLSRQNWVATFPRYSWQKTCFVVIFILALLVFVSLRYSMPVGVLLALELFICGFCVFLCVTALDVENADAAQWLEKKLVWAGDGSFSTYLTHGFVMGPAARILSLLSVHVSPVIFALTMVLVCSAVGMFLFRYFENPLLGMMNAKWGRLHSI
nr:acyltransferase [uncultured Albidiferax sp.]